MNIIFLGTPEYAVPYLEGLIQADMKPSAVFSQPDRPVGRKQVVEPTPVKRTALANDIPVLQPEDIRTAEWVERIKALTPDLIVVVAFGQIIPQAILDIPPKGCVNVHPSLLPRHRGASPLQETILQGDAETAVTIMLMDYKMDHGPILAQEKIQLTNTETSEALFSKTIAVGVPLLVSTLNNWLTGSLQPTTQDDSLATYTRLLTRDSGKVGWSKGCIEIERQIRALNPWPGTWCDFNGKRLKIFSSARYQKLTPHQQGTFCHDDNHLLVVCADGVLELTDVQLEGKKRLSGAEFVQGYKKLLTAI